MSATAQSQKRMSKDPCQSKCRHTQCVRRANLSVDSICPADCLIDKVELNCVGLENIVDMGKTLVKIMQLCGINPCKCEFSLDTIVYHFIHYDHICDDIDVIPMKQLRKNSLKHKLMNECLMNRVEVELAYSIIKKGFFAFYFNHEDAERILDTSPLPPLCIFWIAAKRMAQSYACFNRITCAEQKNLEDRIACLYLQFYDRVVSRATQPIGPDCGCCYCRKKKEEQYCKRPPPCRVPCVAISKSGKKTSKLIKIKCSNCCRPKTKKQPPARCPVCHYVLKDCVCEKFDKPHCDWVKSIWERPDFKLYFTNTISARPQHDILACQPTVQKKNPCKEWFNPKWMRKRFNISAKSKASIDDCDDWAEPKHIQQLMDTINNTA